MTHWGYCTQFAARVPGPVALKTWPSTRAQQQLSAVHLHSVCCACANRLWTPSAQSPCRPKLV